MGCVDRALEGAQQPPLGQRGDAVDAGQQPTDFLATGLAGPDLVTSIRFRYAEAGVGAGQQFLQFRFAARVAVGDADGHGDVQAVVEREGADGDAQACSYDVGFALVDGVEDDDEFLSAEPADVVVPAQFLA